MTEPEMFYEEAVRRDKAGTLPTLNGKPKAVLTDAGWYTPKDFLPVPPVKARPGS